VRVQAVGKTTFTGWLSGPTYAVIATIPLAEVLSWLLLVFFCAFVIALLGSLGPVERFFFSLYPNALYLVRLGEYDYVAKLPWIYRVSSW